MTYKVELTETAEEHLKEWAKSGQKKVLKKISDLIAELAQHSQTGTGHVEQLKGIYSGFWSRQISKGERLIYKIEEDKVIVTIVSMKGHYDDK